MKKKILATMLCVCMLAIAIAGGTMAYFTDVDQATNEFAIGNIAIDLYETIKQTDGADKVILAEQTLGKGSDTNPSVHYDNILPGHVMTKFATVENTGKNDAYIALVIKQDNYLNFNRNIDDYYENLSADALSIMGITSDKDTYMQNITDDIWSGKGWNLRYTKPDPTTDVRYVMQNPTYEASEGVKVLGYGYANYSVDAEGPYYNYNGMYFDNELRCRETEKAGNFDSIGNLHDRIWIVYLLLAPGASYSVDLSTTCPTYIDNNSINAFKDMALDIKAFAIQSSGFTSNEAGQKAAFTELFKAENCFGF